MSIINTNYTQKSKMGTTGVYEKKTEAVNYQKIEQEKRKEESVVEEYKKRHPEDASHVDQQVQAGKKVRIKNGVENVSTEDMSMEEYKKYFYALLDTIPYDPTRCNDESFLKITEKGWEQMKKDSDYEAWILGYFVEDRSVRNPFFGWGGNSGSISFEHFGASIEEHHGEGFSKSIWNGKKPKTETEESWWEKRRKRMKLYWKEQELLAEKRRIAEKKENQRVYRNHQLESQQRLRNFLTDQKVDSKKPLLDDTKPAVASLAYESTIRLFSQLIK